MALRASDGSEGAYFCALTIRIVNDARALLGRRIRALRQERKLSQEELAHRARLYRTYLGGIERGERNPSLLNITRIGNALDVRVAELFADFPKGKVRIALTPRVRRLDI